MTTLIVAANQKHAHAIRVQIPTKRRDIRVVSPGDMVAGLRCELIIITDLFERHLHFLEGEDKTKVTNWYRDAVLTRRAIDGLVLSF